MCRTKGGKVKQKVNNVDEQNDKQDDFAFAINDNMPDRLNFCVGGVNVKMLIDSGATSNVMG